MTDLADSLDRDGPGGDGPGAGQLDACAYTRLPACDDLASTFSSVSADRDRGEHKVASQSSGWRAGIELLCSLGL